jgi:hypothetical protein
VGTRRDPPRAAVDFAATPAAPTDALMAVCARASTKVSTWSTRWTVVVRLDQATNSAMALIVCDKTGSPMLNGAITFTPGPAGTVVECGRVQLEPDDRRTTADDAMDAYWVFLEHLARGLRQPDPHVEVPPGDLRTAGHAQRRGGLCRTVRRTRKDPREIWTPFSARPRGSDPTFGSVGR